MKAEMMLKGSDMMETKPVFSMLMGTLAQMVILMAVFWVVMALGGAAHLLAQVGPAAAAAAAGGFALNRLVMRSRRPLILMLALDMIWAAATSTLVLKICDIKAIAGDTGLASGWVTATFIFTAAAVIFALLSQMRWESSIMDENTLMLQLQVLAILGIIQIWSASGLGVQAGFVPLTFFMTAGILAGIAGFKLSGTHAEGTGKHRASRSGIIAVVLAAAGLVTGGAVAFARPLGRALSAFFAAVSGVVTGAIQTAVLWIADIMKTNKTLSDTDFAQGDNFGGESIEHVPGAVDDMSFFRILFFAVFAIMVALLLVVIIRMLLQVTIGTGVKLARKRSAFKSEGSFIERLKALLRELKQRVHAQKILRRNPYSVAALVVWLEAKCSGREDLCRQDGETLRAFIMKLAAEAGKKDAEARTAFADLAAAADAACYSREGSILTKFDKDKSDKIKEFFTGKGA